MHSKSLQLQLPVSIRWSWTALAMGFALAFACFAQARADEPAPTYTATPATNGAFIGGTTTFSVTGPDQGTNTIQWRFGTIVLAGQTNASLVLSNLTTAYSGSYAAVVSGSFGSVTSSVAKLFVSSTGQPQIVLGNITTNAAAIANGTNNTDWYFPVTLQTAGFEHNLSFTLSYNGALLSNPRFVLNSTGFTNYAATNVSTLPTGLQVATSLGAQAIGVTLTPTNPPWPAASQVLGYFQFTPQPGVDFQQLGNLAINFDGSVVGLQATDVNGISYPVAGSLVPQVIALSAMMFDYNTGVFEQQVQLANPGTNTFVETQVNVQNLTNVTAGIQVKLMQSLGAYIDIYGNFFYGGALAPNSQKTLFLEYYVADRYSLVSPIYSASSVATNAYNPPPGTTVPVVRQGFVPLVAGQSTGFLLAWLTKPGLHYYVQYSDVLGTNNFTVSRAPIVGNGGYVQWVDSGPPKTLTPPSGTNRFYQILQTN